MFPWFSKIARCIVMSLEHLRSETAAASKDAISEDVALLKLATKDTSISRKLVFQAMRRLQKAKLEVRPCSHTALASICTSNVLNYSHRWNVSRICGISHMHNADMKDKSWASVLTGWFEQHHRLITLINSQPYVGHAGWGLERKARLQQSPPLGIHCRCASNSQPRVQFRI